MTRRSRHSPGPKVGVGPDGVLRAVTLRSWRAGEISYDEARRWVAAHPVDAVSMGEPRRQALRLAAGSIPAMVEVLAHGTNDEVAGAFSVLYHHGVRVERHGDSPETGQYQITFPDGSVRMVHPDNLTADDFGDEAPQPESVPPLHVAEGFRDLRKPWISEGVLATLTTGTIGGAVETSGVPRVIFIVAAIGVGALLAWSLLLLTFLTFLASIVDRRKPPRNRPDGM